MKVVSAKWFTSLQGLHYHKEPMQVIAKISDFFHSVGDLGRGAFSLSLSLPSPHKSLMSQLQ